MGDLLKILAWVIAGIVLLWVCFIMFFGTIPPFYRYFLPKKKRLREKDIIKGEPGDPQTCLVCSMKLPKGSRVQTTAFPPASGGKDRLMYIRGCDVCLDGRAPRKCPVCQTALDLDDFLAARMFERAEKRKNHVHVLGCNHCKKTGDINANNGPKVLPTLPRSFQ